MSYDPYIHFQGNCRGAMTAYQTLFGGTLQMMTYAEAPQAPEAHRDSDRIMHATLTTAGRMLMASDFPPGMEGDPQQALTVSHIAASRDEAVRIFDALSVGGSVTMQFQGTFWSDGFGTVKDRFGTHWMVSAPWRAV